MDIQIRPMIPSDIQDFPKEFSEQGWDKPVSQYQRYYDEQENGTRRVFVAASGAQVLGYTTLLPNDKHGPFANKNIPTVCDFNVLKKYQKHGAGTAILDAVEDVVQKESDIICLGVGLHSGYGTAQRMYVKRGYIFDGSGVWYQDRHLEEGADCKNDDCLVLYLSKRFR